MDIKYKENVYIYGAGYYGKKLINILDSVLDIKAKCFFVSKGFVTETEYIYYSKNGYRAVEIKEINAEELRNATLIISAVKDRDVILDGIKKYNVAQIMFKEEFDIYIERFEQIYFQLHNIDIFSSDIIQFGNVKTVYPNDEIGRKVFFETMGDELAPGVFDDYSFVVDGNYEHGEVRLEEGDTVLDVGANFGLFACYAANKGNQVIACEPSSKALEILRKNQKIYGDYIQILPIGLSDRKGKAVLYQSDDCALCSFVTPNKSIGEDYVEIDTIDNLVEIGKITKIDYIKADIEGAERNMLAGAKKTLKTMAPKLAICTYHFPDDKEVLERIILEANPNYVIEHKWKKLYAYVPKE